MLSLIKKKNSLHLTKSVLAGIDFNPLFLPSYRAGYLMNYDNDTPKGSINNILVAAQWFDAKVLSSGSKLMSRGNTTATGLVNSFKCEDFNSTTARLKNTTQDNLTGITSFTYLLGFIRNTAGTGHMLVSSRNDADTIAQYSLIQNDGKLRLTLGSGANTADAITANRYDNNAWHSIICVIDQTNKSARIITHTGEDITNVEAALPAPIAFTMTNNDYFQFGAWWVASLQFQPGFFGDVIIFNEVFNNAKINAAMRWECLRLNIAHTPI